MSSIHSAPDVKDSHRKKGERFMHSVYLQLSGAYEGNARSPATWVGLSSPASTLAVKRPSYQQGNRVSLQSKSQRGPERTWTSRGIF